MVVLSRLGRLVSVLLAVTFLSFLLISLLPGDPTIAMRHIDRVAAAKGISRSVAAYSWLMAHPAGIIPIIGSQQVERIAEGASALSVQWTRTDWYAVLVAARGERLP